MPEVTKLSVLQAVFFNHYLPRNLGICKNCELVHIVRKIPPKHLKPIYYPLKLDEAWGGRTF